MASYRVRAVLFQGIVSVTAGVMFFLTSLLHAETAAPASAPPAWFPVYPNGEIKTESREGGLGSQLAIVDMKSADQCNIIADWYREKLKTSGFQFQFDKVKVKSAGGCEAQMLAFAGDQKFVNFVGTTEPGKPTNFQITIREESL
jgi:hypothetical protein